MLRLFIILFIILILYILIVSIIPHLKMVKVNDDTKKEIQNKIFTKETSGNDRASIIYDGVDALNLRMALVKNATKSLDIVMYKIVDSESTQAFFGEVYLAAKRGVRVNILVNGVTYLAYLNQRKLRALNTHSNITCRIYNPVNLFKPKSLHFLMHDKIILADNQYLITGGRNVDERHFQPNGFDKPTAYDLEVFVMNANDRCSDSVIYEVREYIDQLYESDWTKLDKEKENPRVINELLSAATRFKETNPEFYRKTFADYIKNTVPTNKISLIHNPIEPVKKEPTLGYQLKFLVNQATESVVIQTPYITGNSVIIQSLEDVTNNLDVHILTNSLASSPNIFAFPNYYGHRESFLKTGVNIYEFQSVNSVHNKSWMIDERLLIIGTFNLDARSLFINSEVMLVIDSKELTKNYLDQMEKFRNSSLKVGRNNQYLKDNTVKEKKVPWIKKMLAWSSFKLLRGIEFLL